MSLADKFENQVESGFSRGFDPESARRQLRMSIMLVVAMGVAAFILGFVSPINTKLATKTVVATDASFSGRLVLIDGR